MLFYFLKVSCNKYMMVKQSITKVKRLYSALLSKTSVDWFNRQFG